jgi:hypothetical protein
MLKKKKAWQIIFSIFPKMFPKKLTKILFWRSVLKIYFVDLFCSSILKIYFEDLFLNKSLKKIFSIHPKINSLHRQIWPLFLLLIFTYLWGKSHWIFKKCSQKNLPKFCFEDLFWRSILKIYFVDIFVDLFWRSSY